VPFVEDGFIVNLGDLMRRWTNDKWLSTLHRVVNPDVKNGGEWMRRQSIAFFHNPNRDAVVTPLAVNGEKPKHEAIIAGDFLMQKHLAAVGGQ
jgi:isopenicillin N synthase-like dioxygenase